MQSTKFLTQEHKLILRALDVLDEMSASPEAARGADERDVELILDFLRWFADAHHQAKEETVLFPALRKAAATEDRPVEHMILEHDQERGLIEEIEKTLRLERFGDFVASANRLSSTLRNHIYKEDRILFEHAVQLLDKASDDAVLERLNQFETALDKEIMAEKVRELQLLERRYLRK